MLTSCQYSKTKEDPPERPAIPRPEPSNKSNSTKQNKTQRINRIPKDGETEENPQDTNSDTSSDTESDNTTTSKKPAVFPGWGSNNEAVTQAQEKLQSVSSFAQTYYNNFISQIEIISKNGKMYNNSNGQYFDMQYLCKSLGMNRQLLSFSCEVLLLRGSDVAVFEGAAVPSECMGFGVFTAVKQPNGNKIMLSCTGGDAGMISEQDYRTLLKRYMQNHGDIAIPLPDSEEYQRILNFIRVYDGKYDKYFVRQVQSDQKYAVVTLSPQSNPLDIKEYILVNDSSFWEVAMEGLELENNPRIAVNQTLPDFNLNLLPEFNIAALKNDMKADCSDIYATMVYKGIIESATQVYYSCATAKFCYIVLYSGEKYLGIEKNGIWDIQQVPSNKTALDIMNSVGGINSAFILLDE